MKTLTLLLSLILVCDQLVAQIIDIPIISDLFNDESMGYQVVEEVKITPEDTKKFETMSEERIVNLPQDQNKWYLTVIVKINDAQSTSVKSWFEDAELFALRKQVHYHAISTDSRMWELRYKKMYRNEDCCVRLQNRKGTVVYQATGKNLPGDSDKLFLQLVTAISEYKKRNQCPWDSDPKPKPKPDPSPSPDGGGVPDTVVPEVEPIVLPFDPIDLPIDSPFDIPTWLIALLGVVGGGLGARSAYVTKYYPET